MICSSRSPSGPPSEPQYMHLPIGGYFRSWMSSHVKILVSSPYIERSRLSNSLPPLDRHDSTAPRTTTPAPHTIFQVQHFMSRFQPKPGQECRCQQRRVSAYGAIDLGEIPGPQILDRGRIQRNHLRARCSQFVRLEIITSRAASSTGKHEPILVGVEPMR
jgi:hypothetical protein